MKTSRSLLASLCLLASLPAVARADIIHQMTPVDTSCRSTCWYQSFLGTGAAPDGHSGVVEIASMVVPPGVLFGSWLNFTPQGTFLALVGGTLSTDEVLDPAGAPLDDVHGAVVLDAAFGLDFDTSSATYSSPLLYAGMLLWTPGHTYLVLVGGLITTYEVTDAAGAPLAGIKGISRLAADIVNTAMPPSLAATLFSGAVAYSATNTYLIRTFGSIAATEITDGGASIPGVRGVQPMGGVATPLLLDTAFFLWTNTRVHLVLTGPGVYVYDVNDPSGAPITHTWGVTRQSPMYAGGGFFQGAAAIITQDREVFALVGGSIATYDVVRPTGGAITSNVSVPASNSLLRQASGTSTMFGSWQPGGGVSFRGTVIGALQ
jgi:hypothetical protein